MKSDVKNIKLVESAVRKIRNGITEAMPVHTKDDLLRGITFEELIETLQSNEPTHDERTVRRVFEEILRANLEDARAELRDNMKFILKQASAGHNGK